ncbi:DUF6343 family protein [Streptomyces sp. CRN 30]|uniref:DUF6343 family protein n=1 Tax=Streptomyces sp. CRN 30 TaxID=3075613 RepID=UPI002A81EC34|nr:DUF6343 family protein [Streptomyces sp. CRN 30]
MSAHHAHGSTRAARPPVRDRAGTEPRTARSPLRLRRVLAAVFLPLFALGAAGFAVGAARWTPGDRPDRDVLIALAAACAALAVIAAADLAVVHRRLTASRR